MTACGDGVCRVWKLREAGNCWQELKGWSEGAANLVAFSPCNDAPSGVPYLTVRPTVSSLFEISPLFSAVLFRLVAAPMCREIDG